MNIWLEFFPMLDVAWDLIFIQAGHAIWALLLFGMFCNLFHFGMGTLCIIEDSGYLLNYIFQGFFWIDICSVKGHYAIGYWINEVFLFFAIFANSLYVDINVDFFDAYFDSERNMIKWFLYFRVKYVVAKSQVARGQEYKVYNRIGVLEIVHKSSRSGISRGESSSPKLSAKVKRLSVWME